MYKSDNPYTIKLSNFSSTKQFFDVANKLNHVVDRRRVFRITDISDTEMTYYSLEDPKKKVSTVNLDRVLVAFFDQLVDFEDAPRQPEAGDVFYLARITGLNENQFVISLRNPDFWDNDPKSQDDIIKFYKIELDLADGKYSYVSLANIIPLQNRQECNFADYRHTLTDAMILIEDVDTNDYASKPTFLRDTWGVIEDPKDQCHYDLTNQTIEFGFDSLSEENNFRKYLNYDINIKPNEKRRVFEPQLVQLMQKLSEQTNATFDIFISRVN